MSVQNKDQLRVQRNVEWGLHIFVGLTRKFIAPHARLVQIKRLNSTPFSTIFVNQKNNPSNYFGQGAEISNPFGKDLRFLISFQRASVTKGENG